MNNSYKTEVILSILLLAISCSVSSPEPSDPDPFPQDAGIPADLEIKLERTGCFAGANACPTYKLTVNADGSVVFEGIDLTTVKGRAEDKISPEKMRLLIAEFQRADFFNLKDSYDYPNCPSIATDSPNANTSIRMNGQDKTIHHYLGCLGEDLKTFPAQLTELEDKIDEIVGTDRWTK